MSKTAGKILVIRGGAIGDFILTLPVLTALRVHFPNTHLELLGYQHIAQLACAAGLVDGLRSIEARPLAGFFAQNGELAEDWCAYFAGFSAVLSFLYDPDEIFQANVARCSKAQFIAGPHRPDETAGQHATDVFLQPLQRLAIFDTSPIPSLRFEPSPAAERAGHPPSATWFPRVAFHPGSGAESKNWAEPKWAAFLDELVRRTRTAFVLVGGEAEGDRLRRLASQIPAERLHLAANLPLPTLGRLLADCHGFVGHDSGITHLAAAVGLGGLALWAGTARTVWAPRSDKLQIISHPAGINQLEVDTVIRALQETVNFVEPENQ